MQHAYDVNAVRITPVSLVRIPSILSHTTHPISSPYRTSCDGGPFDITREPTYPAEAVRQEMRAPSSPAAIARYGAVQALEAMVPDARRSAKMPFDSGDLSPHVSTVKQSEAEEEIVFSVSIALPILIMSVLPGHV